MLRRVLSVVAGLVVFIVLVALCDAISSALFPIPGGLDINDTDSVRAYIANTPVAGLAIVLAGSTFGALAGSFVTGLLIGEGSSFWPYITGLFGMAATLANALTLPHPTWFVAAAPLLVIAATILGALLARRSRKTTAPRARASAKPPAKRTGRRSQGA